MRYWLREIGGWLLVGVGLLAFLTVYDLCAQGKPVSAGVMAVVAIFIYRGGIHLLKVAVAARVCQQTQDRLYPEPPRRPPAPPRGRVSAARAPSGPARPSW